jgi:CBS domain-containing protein
MQIKEIMTAEVEVIDPTAKLAEASRLMRDDDVGALPVGEGDRLIGMITDRDIVIRAIAEGKDPTATTVREAMGDGEVLYCYDDQTSQEVAENMGDNQVRRLPVLNREKRLVGIVSLGDIAANASPGTSGDAIKEVSKGR